MFVITINHKATGPTEYQVFTKDEADSEDIKYLHWQKANANQWALTDDDYVAKVISKKTYTDKQKRMSYYYRMPFGYIMWNPKYPDKKFCCGGRVANNTFSGRKWLDVKVESEGYQALAMWAALTENRDVAIDQVYGPVSESKRRKLKRHMRTEVFKKMKRDEAQRLLTDNMMDANYFIDLMKKGVDIALKKEDVNGIRGFVNDGMEIHGMKDKETVTVTDKLEATQTRKLIDNINAEEDKLVASRTTKMPIKEVKDGDD